LKCPYCLPPLLAETLPHADADAAAAAAAAVAAVAAAAKAHGSLGRVYGIGEKRLRGSYLHLCYSCFQ